MPEDCQSFMPHLGGLVLLGKLSQNDSSDTHFTLKNYLNSNRICGFIPDQIELLRDTLNFAGDVAGAIDREKIAAESLAQAESDNPGKIDMKIIAAPQEYLWDLAPGPMPSEQVNIVVWDFGLNYGMLRDLRKMGCRLRVVPPTTSPEQIIALHPDGVIIAGGPVDQNILESSMHRVERLVGIRPTLGIGGGAMILARALGIAPIPLERAHFGSDMKVEDFRGQIFATYQAHSMSLKRSSLTKAGALITHLNVRDGSIEGFGHSEFSASGTLFSMTGEPIPSHLHNFISGLNKTFNAA